MFFNTGLYHRTVPSQDEMSFNFLISPQNSNGEITLTVTGDNGQVNNLFRFNSGKIFDINNRNVWGYSPREQVEISGNIGLDYLNYFINKEPVCLYQPLNNINYYNGINLNFNKVSGEGEIHINGRRPAYDFISTGLEYLATEDIVLELSCEDIDGKRNFKIFSGIIDSDAVPYGIKTLEVGKPISNTSSSFISLSGRSIPFLTGDVISTIGAQIFTNFGTIDKQFVLKILKAPIYYTEWVTGYTGISDFIVPPSQGVYNYELRSVYPEDREFSLSVQYVSGYTGIYSGIVEYSGNKFSELSGFIQGHDYITGYSFIQSGVYSDLQGYLRTGDIYAPDRLKFYPTGEIKYTYSLPVRSNNKYEYCPGGNYITGTGVLTSGINEVEKFLLGGSKYTLSDLAFSGFTDISSGIYKDKLNFKSAVFSTGYSTVSYTGYFHVDDSTHLWSAECVTGKNFTGEALNKIFIEGKWYDRFCANDLDFSFGFVNNDKYIDRRFNSGEYLESAIFYKDNYKLSDILYPTVNTDEYKKVFLGDLYRYFADPTGIVGGMKFNAVNLFNDGNLTHYSFCLDIETKQYPYIFKLQRSIDGSSWSDLDSRTGISFYPSGCSWFKLAHPSNISTHPFYRLVIESGIDWPHVPVYTGEKYTGKYQYAYGIKNLNFYESLPVFILNNNNNLNNIPSVYTGISDYSISKYTHSYPEYSFPGTVIYSRDGSGTNNPAWRSFNKSGEGAIYTNLYGDAYVGFEFSGIDELDRPKKLTNFFINFKNGFIPKYLSVSTIDDSNVESMIYEKYNPSIIESGLLSSDIEDIHSYLFRFTKKTPNPLVYSSVGIDTFSGIYTGDAYRSAANFLLRQEILPNGLSNVSNGLYFGESFCISENNNNLFVAAPGSGSPSSGSIYSFGRFGDYWTGGVSGLVPYPQGLSNSYRFGTSISCSFDASVLAVGAKSNINSTGAVFIYEKESSLSPKYLYKTGFYGPYYGGNLLVSNQGGVILAPAPEISSIDVFSSVMNQPWSKTSTIAPTNPSFTGFGVDLDLNYQGNFLIVGHPRDNTKAVDGGSAYLYSGYVSGDRYYYKNVNILYGDGYLDSDSPYRSDLFGSTVTVNDNNQIICVGGPYDYRVTGVPARKLGAIWTFRNTGVNFSGKWSPLKKLISPSFDFEIGSLGLSVSSAGDFILAGSKNGPVLFSGNSPIGSPPPVANWSYVGPANVNGLDPSIYDIKNIKFLKSNPYQLYATSFKKDYSGAGKVSYFVFQGYVYSDFVNPNYPNVFQ